MFSFYATGQNKLQSVIEVVGGSFYIWREAV